WLELVPRLLRPARPHLDRCLGELGVYLDRRRASGERRARAMKDCARRMNDARSAVFAKRDGVVPSLMTDLEREWRWLARRDPDVGLMELWTRIAPPGWIDRK